MVPRSGTETVVVPIVVDSGTVFASLASAVRTVSVCSSHKCVGKY
jgi:hypothetical protein